VNIDIFHETVSSLSQVLNFFLNFHSLRISIINVSILAFCQVLLNEYDDDDDDDDGMVKRVVQGRSAVQRRSN